MLVLSEKRPTLLTALQRMSMGDLIEITFKKTFGKKPAHMLQNIVDRGIVFIIRTHDSRILRHIETHGPAGVEISIVFRLLARQQDWRGFVDYFEPFVHSVYIL